MKKTRPATLCWLVVAWIVYALTISPAPAQTVQTNLTVIVQQPPALKGGNVQGSLQMLIGRNLTVHAGFAMSGDLLVPGTPVVTIKGQPAFAGTIAGGGSASPSGYKVTLNDKCLLHQEN